MSEAVSVMQETAAHRARKSNRRFYRYILSGVLSLFFSISNVYSKARASICILQHRYRYIKAYISMSYSRCLEHETSPIFYIQEFRTIRHARDSVSFQNQ